MLIFLVHRSNYYKFLGPLLEDAIARDLPVEIWIWNDARGKEYLDPSVKPESLNSIRSRKFDTLEALSSALATSDAKAIFSLHTREKYKLISTRPTFVTLQHGIDSFIETDLAGLCNTDYLCLYSSFWIEWGAKYFHAKYGVSEKTAYEQLSQKAIDIGFPQLDGMGEIDPVAIRTKYGVDKDARVVLYLPITLGNINGSWPRFFEGTDLLGRIKTFWQAVRKDKVFFGQYLPWLLHGWSDKKLTQALKAFAHNNGAVLIAKARKKDPLRPWLKEAADLAIYDEADYPSTTLELMSIADVCIHFYSFAALESAYCGVFGVTVDRPSPAADVGQKPPPHHVLWRRAETGTAFNFPKVNAWMTIPEVIRELPGAAIDNFRVDAEARETYIQTYLGASDGMASRRILDLVSNEAKLRI
ncbi:MAG: hypothetical protein KIT70_03445 [Anaerolineales bacterium]|nr:MAG: hypothetical protein KIT70_03445 [Anaerolineales bacterium]